MRARSRTRPHARCCQPGQTVVTAEDVAPVDELDELVPDDVRGEPTGHFIVIAGYEQWGRRFSLRDPSAHVPHPEGGDGRQVVDAQSLINAILLGDLTYDAVLLEIWRADREGEAA